MSAKNLNDLSFEQALGELEKIVQQAESGKETLENLINNFQYGNDLKTICEKRLQDAKMKIEIIVNNNSLNPELKPFNKDED